MVKIEFQNAEDVEPLSLSANMVIAVFCTFSVLLNLWYVMDILTARVLYDDTDSIIFS